MRLVTAAEMRGFDRETIDVIGIPAALLMEHAGRAVADEVALCASPPARVVVICGSGNNGGDGFVCARWLRERGFQVAVLLTGKHPTGDAALHLAIYEKLGGSVAAIGDPAVDLAGAAVIVDAILGTGLTKDVEGKLAAVIAAINVSPAVKLAVDVPSGMESDTGRTLGAAVRADRTITFGFAKIGLVSHPGCELAGQLRVADIGIPARLADGVRARLLDDATVAALLPRRGMGAHKGTTGHVLLVAGSSTKAGAALLAASGALRGGAGLVTLALPPETVPLAAGRILEVMLAGFDPLTARVEELASLCAGKKVLVCGCGMPTEPAAGDLVIAAVAALEIPMVLDADALNHLARDPGAIARARAPVILTPHPGEAARLLGSDTKTVQADRVGAARKLAADTRAVVILKGARTVIAAPDGRVAINPTGNPGMATGGTGDVLAGLTGALVAQGLEAFAAAQAAAYVHGRAGDLCRLEVGMTAGDLAGRIPEAIRALTATPAPVSPRTI